MDGRYIRYWEELDEAISAAPGKTLRFGIRRGIEAEERDVTPARWERRGPLNIKETVGWIGVSPRFQLPEVGIIDLTSPAAQAGLRTFDYITSVNGTPVSHWSEFERAVARAGASPLRISYLRGTHSALPFVHVEIQEPGTAVVIPQPIIDPVSGRRYETGIQASELFVYSVEPGSPADGIGLRRGDQVLELDGQALLHWNLLRQRLAQEPQREFRLTWVSPGGGRHQATFKQEVHSQLDAYHQEEQRLVFGATNRFAWKTADPVPIRNRFFYAVGHAFERTGEIVVFTAQGFFQISTRRNVAAGAGGALDHRLRGGRGSRAGSGPVPVADGASVHQHRPAQLPAHPHPGRRPADVHHPRAVQTATALGAGPRGGVLRGHRVGCASGGACAQERYRALPAATLSPMRPTLAFDTSTPCARVAVLSPEGDRLATAEKVAARHSSNLLRLCDEVLRATGVTVSDLAALACGAGPGSFTGLRVGLAVAKGLALADRIPLVLVSSARCAGG